MRYLLLFAFHICILNACLEPEANVPPRSDEFVQSYYQGLDLLERYRLREAERAFARCARLEPEAAEGHWQLGRVWLLQGRIEEGVSLLERALALDSTLDAARELVLETFLGRGKEALEDGRFAQAQAYLQRALAVDARGYEPLYWAAITALWQEDYVRADSLLQVAVAVHPEPLELRWHLGLVQEALGRGQDAVPESLRFVDAITTGEIGGRFSEIGAVVGVDKFDGGRASAWADYDGDGDLDLAVIGHPKLAYFRNDGGRFAERTRAAGLSLPTGGIGVQTADYDNDGDADLYATRDGWFGGGENVLFQNDGRGVFAEVTEAAGTGDSGSSFCAAWSDFDRDGWLDLYVANGTGATGDSTNVLYRAKGDGSFADVAIAAGVAHRGQTLSVTWGDFDADGWPDLYACNFTEPNALYRNRGNGTFADQTQAAGVAAAHIDGFITFVLDYDNDGALDLFVANWSQYETVLADRVAGAMTSARDRPVLYRNQGDGTFVDMTEAAGLLRALGTMSGVPGDVDNDGWVDIYLGNGGPQMGRRDPDTLYRNKGDGTFLDVTEAAGLGHVGKSHGVTFADYDRDGDLDLYAPVGGAQPGDQWSNALYRNEGFGHHYLVLALQGTQSNRDGIGARVEVRAGDLVQFGEVASGYSFGNSSSLELEFGLGQRRQVERIEVAWPSGQVDVYRDIAADQHLVLREGETR
ncbi:MAG: FG-GAP-like repeat-containing protein [Candidatus Latescibacterota bacterium]|nr:FG-GAP-like repeat-containing protein [Candidatus Latescibacterota bacterium]